MPAGGALEPVKKPNAESTKKKRVTNDDIAELYQQMPDDFVHAREALIENEREEEIREVMVFANSIES